MKPASARSSACVCVCECARFPAAEHTQRSVGARCADHLTNVRFDNSGAAAAESGTVATGAAERGGGMSSFVCVCVCLFVRFLSFLFFHV